MIGSRSFNDDARRGQSRVWRPGVALMLLAAAATPFAGPAAPAAAGDLAATPGWSVRPPVQVARVGLDVATANGTIFAVGGFDPDRPGVFSSVEARRTDGSGTWRTVAPMPTARANAAVAALGETVYAVGGFTDELTLDVVEKFDPATGTWTSDTRLPAPRGAAGAAALGDLLYVAGGLVTAGPGPDGEEITASVLAYSRVTRRWTPVAPMPTARWRLRLVAAGGQLFAIGGQSETGASLSTVERYDPGTDTWTTVAPMHQDRAVPGVVAVSRGLQRFIVVVGGCQFTGGQRLPFLRSTEAYNVDTGHWFTVTAQLPGGRCSLGAAVDADGSVLAISGAGDVRNVVTATPQVDALKI